MRMWNERFLKVIPATVFLFCLLEILELCFIFSNINQAEKLEAKIKNNLKMLESITILLDEHLEGKRLEHFQDKKIKIK